MTNKIDTRRIRFPAPQPDDEDDVIEVVLDEEEEAPCSEYVVMSQESEPPALQEHLKGLHELGSRTMY
jgi:hypothetical protein